jgi:hypothetical protein
MRRWLRRGFDCKAQPLNKLVMPRREHAPFSPDGIQMLGHNCGENVNLI